MFRSEIDLYINPVNMQHRYSRSVVVVNRNTTVLLTAVIAAHCRF